MLETILAAHWRVEGTTATPFGRCSVARHLPDSTVRTDILAQYAPVLNQLAPGEVCGPVEDWEHARGFRIVIDSVMLDRHEAVVKVRQKEGSITRYIEYKVRATPGTMPQLDRVCTTAVTIVRRDDLEFAPFVG